MRILVLTNTTPWPPRSGGNLRILRVLERVAARHEVTLGCHVWGPADVEGVAELNRQGIRTIGGPVSVGSVRRHALAALRLALRGIPPEIAQYQAMELHALVRRGDYDLLQIEESILAPYATSRPNHQSVPCVLSMHDVHFVQDRRIARIEPRLSRKAIKYFNAAWMRSYEPRMATTFQRVITVSDADRLALQGVAPEARVTVIPNGVDTRALVPLPAAEGPPTLLFIGSMFYRPCADGAVWLVRDVVPMLRRTHPDVQVFIVGRRPTDEVLALASDHVHVVGEVEDVQPYYARATLAVVPLRAGGGSRLKILEAMALGRAVVSTTMGAEGLEVTDGTHLALADTAAELATVIARLLSDAAERTRLVQQARALVEAQYGWDDIAAQQLAVYDELTNPVTAADQRLTGSARAER